MRPLLPKTSFRLKMVLWYTAILLGTLFVFRVATYQVIRSSLYDDFDASLHAEVSWMRQLLDAYQGRGIPDAEIRREIAERSGLSPRKEYIEIFDPEGTLYFRSENLFGASLADLHSDPYTEPVSIPGFHEYGIRLFAARSSGQAIYVGYPLEDIENAISDVGSSFLFLIPFALALAFVGGFFLVTRFVKPIRALDRYAEALVRTPLDRELDPPTTRRDELGQLMVQFHEIVASMRAGSRRALSFATLASHELRNPLAILRADLEQAMSRLDSREMDAEDVASAYDEVLRLTHVVDGLLTLGTMEARTFRLDLAPLDIGRFLTGIAEEARALCEARGIAFEAQGGGAWIGRADQAMLRQALFNLLDNALKHTPAGGHVGLTWRVEGGSAVISLTDDGEGIPVESLPRVFDFFYRAGDSGRKGAGAGLGLPLARRVVESHGGTIEVTSRMAEGTTVTIRIPLDMEMV